MDLVKKVKRFMEMTPVEDKWVPKIPDVKVDDSTDTPSEDDIKAMLEAGDESKKDDE